MQYVEIRAGEGGEDAELFAAQLTNAVLRWCDRVGVVAQHDDGAIVLDRDCL